MKRNVLLVAFLGFVLMFTAIGMLPWVVEGPKRWRIRCRIGWHHYVAHGWAGRTCTSCERHETNIYEDGKAEWRNV